MQIETAINNATGNGKTVRIAANINTHTGKSSYFGEVTYDENPKLDFAQKFTRKSDAQRWFKTWKTLAA